MTRASGQLSRGRWFLAVDEDEKREERQKGWETEKLKRNGENY